MFTGLVQEVGTVDSMSHDGAGARLRVATGLAAEVFDGDSVLVNGVCLTAASTAAGGFEADVSPETLRRSSLGELEPGDRVNLELSLRASDRLGGHIVQGHVDAVGEVRSLEGESAARNLRVEAPPGLLRYVVEKGSIAVDGVSLTITDVNEREFGVSLIPETISRTTLGDVSPGRRVNLEIDVIAKYVEKLVPGR